MVKRLRHRPFTAVTGVQIPLESFSLLLRAADYKSVAFNEYADVAQLAEQLICNQQVVGSTPTVGFIWTFSSVG